MCIRDRKTHTPFFCFARTEMADRNPVDYVQYSKTMRKGFSLKEMVDEGANINHGYFLVKKGTFWSAKEDEALKRGLHVFGVGKWSKIKYFELKNYTEVELELRTCILLGTSDLTPYMGKRIEPEEIETDREENLERAKKERKLAYNMYIPEQLSKQRVSFTIYVTNVYICLLYTSPSPRDQA
eukprot:TRINITY_DN24481_c0_g1_i1.p2 TRINITY_DN24481_c0_g1~~TRINITY_DN24481_c0_g1_i1.p2  ORF type:complete len:202 (+),score=29.15 TRINITY_DN24481_c0_g1_i1:60-608(+)